MQAHCTRNRAQQPPNSERLRLHEAGSRNGGNRWQLSSNLPEEDTDEQSPEEVPSRQRVRRNSKKTNSNPDPEQLGFYSEEWASVLVQAQQWWQLHLIVGRPDPFPEREHHLSEARKILADVIAESLIDGQLLDDSK